MSTISDMLMSVVRLEDGNQVEGEGLGLFDHASVDDDLGVDHL